MLLNSLRPTLLAAAIALAAFASPASAIEQYSGADYPASTSTRLLNSASTFEASVTLVAIDKLATHRYTPTLPKGASLHALSEEKGQPLLQSEIQVKSANGQVLGIIDAAWAHDADGKPLTTYFMIEGTTLLQVIETTDAAPMTVTTQWAYSGINAPADAAYSEPGVARSKAYVPIPGNYVYNPDNPPHNDKGLHDYCTMSPDGFGSVSFKGPCARHDICLDNTGISRSTCDVRLRSDLRSNCDAEHGNWDARRHLCRRTADIYYGVVVANTFRRWIF